MTKKKKWFFVSGFLALVLIASAAFFARPLYKEVKRWRALTLVEEAREAWNEDDYMGAIERIQAAYQLYPHDPEVIRETAFLYMRLDPARALPFWEEVVKKAGVLEDYHQWIETALLVGDLKSAQVALAQLEVVAPGSIQTRYLKARVLAASRDYASALAIARELIALERAPEGVPLLYVQLTQLSPDPAVQQEGVDYLLALSGRQDDLGLEALRVLSRNPNNTDQQWGSIIGGLKDHPSGTRKDRLLGMALEYQKTGDREALINGTKELYDLLDAEDEVELGRWLNQNGLYEETALLVDPKLAEKRRDLFLIWVDALAVTNQWSRLKEILKDSSIPLDSFLRHLFLARVYAEEGDFRRTDIEWDKVRLNSGSDPEKLWFLVDYAEKLGLVPQAQETLERLTELPGDTRKAYEKWLVLEQRQGNVAGMNEVLRRMSEYYAKDDAVLNDFLYTNFLLKKDIKSSLERAIKLQKTDPNLLAYRITLALGYMRVNEPQKALMLFEGFKVPWGEVRPGWRAVFVAVLRANELDEAANKIVDGLSPRSLLPEERKLL